MLLFLVVSPPYGEERYTRRKKKKTLKTLKYQLCCYSTSCNFKYFLSATYVSEKHKLLLLSTSILPNQITNMHIVHSGMVSGRDQLKDQLLSEQ